MTILLCNNNKNGNVVFLYVDFIYESYGMIGLLLSFASNFPFPQPSYTF